MKVGNALHEHRLINGIGDLGDHDAVVLRLDSRAGAHVDLTSARGVRVADAARAVDNAVGGEIGTLDIHQNLVERAIGVIHTVDRTVNDLTEIVRGNIGRHTDGDTDRAVDKHVREARGKHRGLVARVVEVAGHRNDLFFNVGEHIIGDLRHSRLGITVSGGTVTVDVTEVTVTLDQGITQGEGLRHSYHRLINGGVAVRMVATKHVTDRRCRLTEGLVIGEVILVHSVENTALTRL